MGHATASWGGLDEGELRLTNSVAPLTLKVWGPGKSCLIDWRATNWAWFKGVSRGKYIRVLRILASVRRYFVGVAARSSCALMQP